MIIRFVILSNKLFIMVYIMSMIILVVVVK